MAKSDYWLRDICLSVYPSIRPSSWNNSTPTGWILEISRLSIFRKFLKKIQVPQKSDKNNQYFT
jgi:hypothetical protein